MFAMSPDLQPVRVHGQWPGINDGFLEQGDLAITSDYRDILSEILLRRTGLDTVANVFPNHTVNPIGLFR